MEMNSKVSDVLLVNGLLPSSALPPVVARMRKFLRLGSLVAQVSSATQFCWLPLAGGPVCRKVPKRPTSKELLGLRPLSM
jgi:hypothetical protein